MHHHTTPTVAGGRHRDGGFCFHAVVSFLLVVLCPLNPNYAHDCMMRHSHLDLNDVLYKWDYKPNCRMQWPEG